MSGKARSSLVSYIAIVLQHTFVQHSARCNNSFILFLVGNFTLETFVKIQDVFYRQPVSCAWLNIRKTTSGTEPALLAYEKKNYRYV